MFSGIGFRRGITPSPRHGFRSGVGAPSKCQRRASATRLWGTTLLVVIRGAKYCRNARSPLRQADARADVVLRLLKTQLGIQFSLFGQLTLHPKHYRTRPAILTSPAKISKQSARPSRFANNQHNRAEQSFIDSENGSLDTIRHVCFLRQFNAAPLNSRSIRRAFGNRKRSRASSRTKTADRSVCPRRIEYSASDMVTNPTTDGCLRGAIVRAMVRRTECRRMSSV